MTSQNTQTKIITNKNITIMKKAIKTAALLAVAMMPVTATAQSNLIKAFDDFTGDKKLKEYIKVNAYTEKDDKDNTMASYYYSYKFEMPLSKRKCIEPVCEAFNKDTGEAYKTHIKNAGIDSEPFVTIAYGKDLDRNMSYGKFINRNYMVMFVKDGKDSLKRYAYTIVWYTDTVKNKFCGMLEKYYGPDPAALRSRNTGHTGNNFSLSEYSVYKPYLPKNTLKQLKRILGNGNGHKFDSQLEENIKWMEKLVDEGYIPKINGNYTLTYNDSIKTDTDFLLRFGNLRAAYKINMREGGVDDTMLNTGLVNKIVELCDNYGHVLSDSTKKMCIDSIKELQDITPDEYLDGFLGEAIKKLKR